MLVMSTENSGNDDQRRSIRHLVLLLTILSGVAYAKQDVIVFNNGDRLTGDLKSLERGRLRFKTDATGTINIEWDKVAYLSSDQNIQVETILGARYLGHLTRSDEKFSVVVQSRKGPIKLNNTQVVHMTPIEDEGVNRIDGEVTAGYNFTKANEVTQLNFGVELDYRTEVRIWSLDLDTVLTDSATNEASQRESLDLNYTRLRSNRWLMTGNVSLNRNDELGIDLRTSIGGGGGRILRQTDHSALILEGGLLGTRENIADSSEDADTIEAYAKMKWDWFRYDTPELDLSTSLEVIPNLSDQGRVRGELDISFKWEMIEDVFWELSLYDSYDSKPAIDGAEKNDYGIISSFGYDF